MAQQGAVRQEILSVGDVCFPNRNRISVAVPAPTASTQEEVAALVVNAVVEIQAEKAAHTVAVLVESSRNGAGNGNAIACACYTPDRKGNSGVGRSVLLTLEAAKNAPTPGKYE